MNVTPEALAFVLSEIRNDSAPIGWQTYIPTAKCLLAHYDIKEKAPPTKSRKRKL